MLAVVLKRHENIMEVTTTIRTFKVVERHHLPGRAGIPGPPIGVGPIGTSAPGGKAPVDMVSDGGAIAAPGGRPGIGGAPGGAPGIPGGIAP